MEAQNKIFHTENLELIAKIANLQITINKEYQTIWAKKVLTAQKKYNKLMKGYKTLKTELAGIGRCFEIELRIY